MNNFKIIQLSFIKSEIRFMVIENKFPIQIFLILEKTNINIWSNSWNGNNSFFVYLNIKWLVCLFTLLRNDFFISNNYMIEHTFINFNNNIIEIQKNKKYKFNGLIMYYIYIWQLKLKICFFSSVFKKGDYFNSLDKIYTNLDWLERECSEMFGIYFSSKNDTRNLLLEYSKKDSVMLKQYQCEGLNDIYYSFFENQIICNKNISVEL